MGTIPQKDDKDSNYYVYKAFPRPYLIRKVLKEKEIIVKSTEDTRVVLSELECEWVWGKPVGTQVKTAPFLDYYLERKKNITLWKKSINLNRQGLNNPDINEPVVDIKESIFNKKKDEDATMEESNLVAIGEEEDEGEVDNRYARVPNQNIYENDAEINAELNDREFNNVIDLEANQEQVLDMMNEPVIAEEAVPEATNNDEEEIIGVNDEEEKEDNKNGPKFQKGFVVMRLSVYNFNNHKIKMEFKIKSESNAPNFYVPLHRIKSDVYSNKNKAIAYFHKIHPTRPFGKYSFEYEEIDKKAPEVNPPEASGNQQTGTSTTGGTGNWQDDTNEFEGYQDEISCSACTMLNSLTEHKCTVCGTVLPHRA